MTNCREQHNKRKPTRNSSSSDKAVSITSGCAVTAGLRSSSPIGLVTC